MAYPTSLRLRKWSSSILGSAHSSLSINHMHCFWTSACTTLSLVRENIWFDVIGIFEQSAARYPRRGGFLTSVPGPFSVVHYPALRSRNFFWRQSYGSTAYRALLTIISNVCHNICPTMAGLHVLYVIYRLLDVHLDVKCDANRWCDCQDGIRYAYTDSRRLIRF